VAFFSRPLALRHSKLAAYERELIGLVQVVRHWRPYLWGSTFLVRTDHYSLKYLLDQKCLTIPQHQWASKLIINVVADALSLNNTVDEPENATLLAPTFGIFDSLRVEIAGSPELQ
jgi:hypothetical protein